MNKIDSDKYNMELLTALYLTVVVFHYPFGKTKSIVDLDFVRNKGIYGGKINSLQ